MNTHDIELPQGYRDRPWDYDGDLYTEGQVRAIIEADRQRRGEPVQALLQQARRGRNYSDPDQVFEAVPVSAFDVETAPQPAEPVKMPSDAEILACLRPLYSNDVAAAMGAEDDLRTARLLLSRYGSGQPAVGEEIHVHIEGLDVLTLPLASSGMVAPRFVVHVPAQAQPVVNQSLTTEREAFDQWFCREKSLPADADTTQYDEAYLPYRAWKARAGL